MMDSTTKTMTAKPASSPKMDATQAFRAMAEKGSAQAKEAFEKMTGATTSPRPAPEIRASAPGAVSEVAATSARICPRAPRRAGSCGC